MESAYALLLTAVSVFVMLLATLYLALNGNDQGEKNPKAEKRPSSVLKASSTEEGATSKAKDDGAEVDEADEESEGTPVWEDDGQDAEGPINPSIMPSSDDDIWKVWFDQPQSSKGMSKGQFEDSMKVLGTFNTMADFWDRFSSLMHEKLPTKSNVRVFQSMIRPMWEDPINRDGGKWIVVIPKQKSVGVFNEVLACMVGGKFKCEISGLVLSKKVREDLVSIWTPSGLPEPSLMALRDAVGTLLENHLGLKPEITFMWHDRKNKINISGLNPPQNKGPNDKDPKADGKLVGEREKKRDGETKKKATKSKPKSPGVKPKSPSGVKPKSPQTAPKLEKPVKSPTGMKPPVAAVSAPTTNVWADRAAKAASGNEAAAASPGRLPATAPVKKAPVKVEPRPEPEPESEPEPKKVVDPDGWETVVTKKKGKR